MSDSKKQKTIREIEDLSRSIREYPSSIFYLLRARCYIEIADYYKAISNLDVVISMEEKILGCYYDRGMCYFRLGKYDKAIKDYLKELKLEPKNRGVYYDIALCYREKDMKNKAKEYFYKSRQYSRGEKLKDFLTKEI